MASMAKRAVTTVKKPWSEEMVRLSVAYLLSDKIIMYVPFYLRGF